MMDPKYVLSYDPNDHQGPYIVREYAHTGKCGADAWVTKIVYKSTVWEMALKRMGEMGGEIVLAWSAQQVDNEFTV